MRNWGIGTDKAAGGDLWEGIAKRRVAKCMKMIDMATGGAVIRRPILDVGAGDSLMYRTLQRRYDGVHQAGIDLNDEPYWDTWESYFGTIFSFEVLEHLLNPLFHLQQLRRIIKPSGNLYLVTPNDYSLVYKAQHLLSIKYAPHFHQFNTEDLQALLDKAGWRVEWMQKFHRPAGGKTVSRISRSGIFVHAVLRF